MNAEQLQALIDYIDARAYYEATIARVGSASHQSLDDRLEYLELVFQEEDQEEA